MRLLKVSVVLLVAALAGCNGKQGLAARTEADKLVLNRLNETVRELKFDDIELKDVIQFFRDVSGLNIHVRWGALNAAGLAERMRGVTLHQAEISLGTGLALLLDSAFGAGNATFTVANGVVIVTTHEDARDLAEYLRSYPKGTDSKVHRRTLTRLSETIRKLNFDDTELKEVIQFLRDVSGVGIYVRWSRLNSAGVSKATTVKTRLEMVTLHTALALCLADTAGTGKAGYALADGILVISAPEDAAEIARVINAGPLAAKTEADKRLLKQVNERIHELNFDDIELAGIVQFFRDVTGMGIHVEWSRLKSVGVTRQTPVNVRVPDVTVHTGLILSLTDVAGEKPISYIIKDGWIHISTPEGLKKLREEAAQP